MTIESFRCSQIFGLASGVVLVLMGIVSMAVSIWLLSSTDWKQIFGYQISLMAGFFLVASIIMILDGAYGIWAVQNQRNTHVSVFWGVMIICIILLLISGVLAYALPVRVVTGGCASQYYSDMSGLNETATQAQQNICVNCTCYINTTVVPIYLNGYQTSNIPTNPVKAQLCPNWQVTNYDGILSDMQLRFSCSGWCPGTEGYIYTMTDVNRGLPQKSCFEAVTYWFKIFAQAIVISAFLFAGVICLLMTFVWWNLCEMVDLDTELYMASLNNTIVQPQFIVPQVQQINVLNGPVYQNQEYQNQGYQNQGYQTPEYQNPGYTTSTSNLMGTGYNQMTAMSTDPYRAQGGSYPANYYANQPVMR